MDISIRKVTKWDTTVTCGPGDDWPVAENWDGRQSMRPERVTVLFTRVDGGEIGVGYAVVHGPRVLSGGRLGAEIKREFWGLQEQPEWVTQAVRAALAQVEREG